MNKTIYLEHKDTSGNLTNAYSVKLSNKNGTFGIKAFNGTVLLPANTSVDNPSTGLYEKTINFEENILYVVSWEIIDSIGENPHYIQQEVGPFAISQETIRSVADYRGQFIQGQTGTLLLRITNMDGQAINAEDISLVISDTNNSTVSLSNNVPYLVQPGFYAFDWHVPLDATVGEYYVVWTYTANGNIQNEVQTIVVSNNPNPYGTGEVSLYSNAQIALRQSLSYLILPIQSIPSYREPAKPSKDNRTFEFTFPRWNQSAGVKIFRNNNIVTSGITIDYFKGKVVFDSTLTDFDNIEASYNFRYFSDEQLDTFLYNASQMYNIYPPVTKGLTVMWVPTITYGAAIDAIRAFILAIQFPEIQLILGNAEAANRVAGILETLKKNYEGWWEKALEQKKNGSYVGLTRTMVGQDFALPGGRSRWFRYLFSSGT